MWHSGWLWVIICNKSNNDDDDAVDNDDQDDDQEMPTWLCKTKFNTAEIYRLTAQKCRAYNCNGQILKGSWRIWKQNGTEVGIDRIVMDSRIVLEGTICKALLSWSPAAICWPYFFPYQYFRWGLQSGRRGCQGEQSNTFNIKHHRTSNKNRCLHLFICVRKCSIRKVPPWTQNKANHQGVSKRPGKLSSTTPIRDQKSLPSRTQMK